MNSVPLGASPGFPPRLPSRMDWSGHVSPIILCLPKFLLVLITAKESKPEHLIGLNVCISSMTENVEKLMYLFYISSEFSYKTCLICGDHRVLRLPTVPLSDRGKCSDQDGTAFPPMMALPSIFICLTHWPGRCLGLRSLGSSLSLAGPLGTQLFPLHLSVAK